MSYDGDDPRWGNIDFPRPPWTALALLAVGVLAVILAAAIGVPRLLDDEDAGGDRRAPDAGPIDPSQAEPPSLDELTSDVTLPAPEEGLDIADTGVTTVEDRFDDARREGTFAVVLANPHDDWLAQGVEVSVDLVAADGTVVDTRNGFIDVVLPGQRAAFAGLLLDLPEAVDRLDVDVAVARWRQTGEIVGAFVTTDVVTEAAEFTGVVTTLMLRSTFAEALSDVGVTTVYRDADGAVLGGYETFVDRVDPDVDIPVEVKLLANIAAEDVATTDVHVTAAFGFVPGADG